MPDHLRVKPVSGPEKDEAASYGELNLPDYSFDIREADGRHTIFDPVRRRHVLLTPEEWVRQNVVQFLLQERGCPAGLTSLEHAFQFEGKQKRADIIVYGRDSRPLILVECKATTVPVGQNVFDQIARYNKGIRARVMVVTNGLTHYCYTVDAVDANIPGATDVQYRFLDDMPYYDDITR